MFDLNSNLYVEPKRILMNLIQYLLDMRSNGVAEKKATYNSNMPIALDLVLIMFIDSIPLCNA